MLNRKDIERLAVHFNEIASILQDVAERATPPGERVRPAPKVADFFAGGQGSGKTSAIRAALEGRTEVTITELCDALGIPADQRTMSTRVCLASELRELGWGVATRQGGGARMRVYRPAYARAPIAEEAFEPST